MKRYLYGLTATALVLLASCASEPKILQPDWSGKDKGMLTSVPMNFDTTVLLHLTKAVLHNDLLFIEQEAVPDNLWSLFRIQGDSLLWQGVLLQKGKGPFEIQTRAFVLNTGGDSLVINPTGAPQHFFSISGSDVAAILDKKQWKVYDYPRNIEFVDIMAPTTTGGFLLASRGDKDNMFEMFRTGDMTARPLVSPYPEAAAKMVGVARGVAYNGRIYQQPGADRYVQIGSTGQMVTIFDLIDSTITNRKEVYNELPEFKLAPDGLNLSPAGKNKLGFRTAVTAGYIYLLDVMFKLEDLGVVPDYKGHRLGFSDQLLVFDWEGNPVARFELDTPAVAMSVAPDDSYFYAFTEDPESGEQQVLRFALPKME